MNNLLPKFRWRRSKWGRYCPVELAQGNMVPGRMEFAVGLVHKIILSTKAVVFEALALFYFTRCKSTLVPTLGHLMHGQVPPVSVIITNNLQSVAIHCPTP